jgi:signal transduction histidine kinase
MNKTNLSTWLAALCVVLLVALLVRQSQQMTQLDSLRQQHETFASATIQRQQEAREEVVKLAGNLTTFVTNLESRLAQSEQQAKDKLTETLNTVHQNTAVMYRALGKVIPVELPEPLAKKLATLEARIADENS